MENVVDCDSSFIESLGFPQSLTHHNIPKDIFFIHKRTIRRVKRLLPSSEVRSQSVKTPAQHVRVEKDFGLKYAGRYMENAARSRGRRRSSIENSMQAKDPKTSLHILAPKTSLYMKEPRTLLHLKELRACSVRREVSPMQSHLRIKRDTTIKRGMSRVARRLFAKVSNRP